MNTKPLVGSSFPFFALAVHVVLYVAGMLIGVANVIPGVSGGTIAVSTGVYEKIIDAINNIRKEFKQSVKTLFPFVVGIIIGIIALAFVITFLLNNEIAKVPTTACFIGLVLGGVPMLHNKIKDEKLKWTHIVAFIITLATWCAFLILMTLSFGSNLFATGAKIPTITPTTVNATNNSDKENAFFI